MTINPSNSESAPDPVWTIDTSGLRRSDITYDCTWTGCRNPNAVPVARCAEMHSGEWGGDALCPTHLYLLEEYKS